MSELFLKVHDLLPIYKIDFGKYILLYTPGYSFKIKAIPIQELIDLLKNPERIEDESTRNSIKFILKNAMEAIDKWEYLKKMPFSPECLTIHVGNECNLSCSYCYSKVENTGNKNIVGYPSLDAIKLLIDYIIKNKKTRNERITVVFHGSGEPTFHWEKLVDSYESICLIAVEKELSVFYYTATNGCITESQIDWLAKKMDLIGISCDGPSIIQHKQRFSNNLQYLPIEKVCERILNKGGKFDIRVTVTRETISSLAEITTYLIDECKATNIRIEPVYLAKENGFFEEDAEMFFRHFTEAQNIAKRLGVNFDYSGMRMAELHGSYCDVMRNTIRLTADNVTRNCFCFMSDKEGFITGRYSKNESKFYLSSEINELRKKSFEIPTECFDCINIFHCSRGCPDYCIFEGEQSKNKKLNTFRCHLHQLIAVERIKESAINMSIQY